MKQKRRKRKAKLDWEKVRGMRADRAGGMVMRLVAEKWGVSMSTANNVCQGKIWGGDDMAVPVQVPVPEAAPIRVKLTRRCPNTRMMYGMREGQVEDELVWVGDATHLAPGMVVRTRLASGSLVGILELDQGLPRWAGDPMFAVR